MVQTWTSPFIVYCIEGAVLVCSSPSIPRNLKLQLLLPSDTEWQCSSLVRLEQLAAEIDLLVRNMYSVKSISGIFGIGWRKWSADTRASWMADTYRLSSPLFALYAMRHLERRDALHWVCADIYSKEESIFMADPWSSFSEPLSTC